MVNNDGLSNIDRMRNIQDIERRSGELEHKISSPPPNSGKSATADDIKTNAANIKLVTPEPPPALRDAINNFPNEIPDAIKDHKNLLDARFTSQPVHLGSISHNYFGNH